MLVWTVIKKERNKDDSMPLSQIHRYSSPSLTLSLTSVYFLLLLLGERLSCVLYHGSIPVYKRVADS